MSAGETILVVGGGIGGLTAALALHRAGHPVEVFEQAPELREIGWGITLWMNGMAVMRDLGLAEKLRGRSARLSGSRIWNSKGKLLSDLPARELEKAFGIEGIGVHRGHLLSVLAESLHGIPIRTGYRLEGFRESPQGVEARFENGELREGRFLIGADGLRSRVRAQLINDPAPRYSGTTVWRGLAPRTGLVDDQGVFLHWGRRARLGGWAIDADRVCWFIQVDLPLDSIDSPNFDAFLEDRIAEFSPELQDLVRQTPRSKLLRTPVFVRPPDARWSSKRATLLGDAAHLMPPTLGQGANQAIEDAQCLASSISNATSVDPLGEYARTRSKRTAQVVRAAQDAYRIQALQSSAACALRDWAMRLTPGWVGRRQMRNSFMG